MDRTALFWIIGGVIVVLIILAVAFALTARARSDKRHRAQHEKAEKLRADARESEMAARQQEANAAQERANAVAAAAAAEQARAQAAQAEVQAQRLAGNVDRIESEAAEHRSAQAETLRKADDIDPYAATAENAASDRVAPGDVTDTTTVGDPVEVDSAPATADGAEPVEHDQVRRDHPPIARDHGHDQGRG